jgi:tetratricopeptide (TPR) repeat protein
MNNIEKIQLLVKEIQNLFFSKKHNLIILETKKAIKKYPNVSIFYNMLGLALSNIGKFDNAKLVLEKGHKVNNNDLAIINNLANVYKSIFNYAEAEELYKLSISKNKDYFNAYVNYGNLKRDLNQFNEAIDLYKKALNYNNQIPAIYYSLSMAHQGLGNFKEAEHYSKKTVELNKKFTKADLLISRSRKYSSDDEHLKEMKDKMKNTELNTIEKVDLNFALAKAYEDLGEIKNTFHFLKEGNKLKREITNFDINFEEKTFFDIKNYFSKVNFSKFKNQTLDDKKIIFILGMPRSGTTLIEQIISAHSQVYGSGELPYLPTIINKSFIENKTLSNSKIDKALNNEEIVSKISNEYYSYLKNYDISEKFVTDKAPLNFIWIGFIKIFFPNAKIIHCRRNSKDNCVSLYKNVFEGGINFCYTESELSKYYNLYTELMEFWQTCLPDAFLTVQYEKLVANPKNEIKKLLEYCDLNWEDNCFNFSNNKTPIKTASVGQARNSIYSTSLQSSLKYEIFLKELFKTLQKKSPS